MEYMAFRDRYEFIVNEYKIYSFNREIVEICLRDLD